MEKSLTEKLLDKEVEAIEIDVPMDGCVQTFFENFKKDYEKYIAYEEQPKKIDYFLIKKFLYTAYNNLKDIDFSLNTSTIIELEKKIQTVEKSYNRFSFELNKSYELQYNEIFLQKQNGYKEVLSATSKRKKTSEMYKAKAKSLEEGIKKLKEKAKKYKKDSDEYKKIILTYKKYNTQYTDLIHKAATLKEEAVFLYQFIKIFKETHLPPFKEIFLGKGDDTKTHYVEILNSLGFLFDKELWKEAKHSKEVKSYFKRANVIGKLSSATYLKYYLKTIDKSKNDEKIKRLFEYIENLDIQRISLFSTAKDSLEDIALYLEQEDSFEIGPSTTIEQFKKDNTERKIDLLIVDYSDTKVIKELLLEKKPRTAILVLLKKPSFEIIDNLGKNGIDNMFIYTENNSEFLEKIEGCLS
ncbi:MAG: hypothetical protein OIF32_08675 [Campylobacterales bacterium]|nr:hypothetical protein [Campylobacterales bacterium]